MTGAGALFNYFKVIVSGGRGRNGATVADTSVLFPAFPVAFVQVNSGGWLNALLTTMILLDNQESCIVLKNDLKIIYQKLGNPISYPGVIAYAVRVHSYC